jgi:hypothetical protein
MYSTEDVETLFGLNKAQQQPSGSAPSTTTISTITTTTAGSQDVTTTEAPVNTTNTNDKQCHANGVWKQMPGFDDWCNLNCNHTPSYCPKSHCTCTN